jgi:hypothetical protein
LAKAAREGYSEFRPVWRELEIAKTRLGGERLLPVFALLPLFRRTEEQFAVALKSESLAVRMDRR